MCESANLCGTYNALICVSTLLAVCMHVIKILSRLSCSDHRSTLFANIGVCVKNSQRKREKIAARHLSTAKSEFQVKFERKIQKKNPKIFFFLKEI